MRKMGKEGGKGEGKKRKGGNGVRKGEKGDK